MIFLAFASTTGYGDLIVEFNAALVALRVLELINMGKDIKLSEVFFESVPCLQASKTPLN